MNHFKTPWKVGGGGISPSKGFHLHRRAQHRGTWTYLNAWSAIGTHDPSVQSVQDHTHFDRADMQLCLYSFHVDILDNMELNTTKKRLASSGLSFIRNLVPRSKNEWSYTSTPRIRLHGEMLRILYSGVILCVQYWNKWQEGNQSDIWSSLIALWSNTVTSAGTYIDCYGLDDRGSISGRSWHFFYSIQSPNRLWGPPRLCPMGTAVSFLWVKTAGAWSWPLTSIYCRG
jgi:hypothetical protein